MWQVNCVAFSSDFEIMVTGSDDERVRLFNALTGKLVVKLKGHEGAHYFMYQRIMWNLHSACIAACTSFKLFVRVVLVFFSGAVKAVSISPNSKYFASASYDKTVRVYITRDASLLHILTGINLNKTLTAIFQRSDMFDHYQRSCSLAFTWSLPLCNVEILRCIIVRKRYSSVSLFHY